ncbi:MT-A70-domain-containing protein [Xylaria venustula]|nr:MT-A70-domain-containing protein [Xylaria venustula]
MQLSSVLFKSPDGTTIVIDIPRSLEEAQVLPGQDIARRLVSARPQETPWKTPEPKKDTAAGEKYVSPSAAVAELMTLESVKSALEVVRAGYDGPWCLPRVTTRKRADDSQSTGASVSADAARPQKRKYAPVLVPPIKDEEMIPKMDPYIPEQSYHLLGTIESKRDAFLREAPQFDLVVLDPPWPSRSVKRKSDSYSTVYSMEEARELLPQIPIASHLTRDGLVAIWVTNKAAITDLLTAPGGVLAQWGLEPLGEWIWLKTTSAGEPVLDMESAWRKPWERLLIARRIGSLISLPASRRVIIGVPDIHSRKPNLRGLFQDILPKDYIGLEVFARNLTAGWWSWGNEVLFFQQGHHWVPVESEEATPNSGHTA